MRRLGAGLVAVLVMLFAGCYGYATVPLPGPDAPNRSLGPYSRVTTTSGEMHPLANAVVEDDSVVGYHEHTRARVAIAVGDVRAVEVWSGSPGKSAAAAGAGGAVLVVVVVLVVVGGIALFSTIFGGWQ